MKFIIIFIIFPLVIFAEIPRRVIGFWDSQQELSPDDCRVHTTLEMSLNYLGLDVVYHDIRKPLPAIKNDPQIRGVVICFRDQTRMTNPAEFIDWAIEAIDAGKKIVLMGNSGLETNLKNIFTSADEQNRLYEKIGFKNSQKWIDYPFDYQIVSLNEKLFPFEKKIPRPLEGFYETHITDPSARSYLKAGLAGRPETDVDLIIIAPNGAYIAESFANNYDEKLYVKNPKSLGWYINPFKWFELVFDLQGQPVPDPTTLAGRRVYFATCHGDNWNSETRIEEYKNKRTSCAEVVLQKIIIPYPDLPMAVGIVAADVDPKWVAKKDSQEIAKKYFSLQQVEASSHTYSHPFLWEFFQHDADEKEFDYLYLYPNKTWKNSFLSWMRAKSYQLFSPKEFAKKKLTWGYAIPRAYANEPFDLNKEITGAVSYLNRFAPENNQVKLLIWSGDSRPWDVPVKLADQAGIYNFGGGFARLDSDYPSVIFLYPLGRKPGGFIQLYSTSNAENSYTSNWKDRFYGYQYLPATLENTEHPRRLKPIQLYFHSYSGEFEASINAILSNIAYIKKQSIIPLQVGRYCSMGRGFYSTEMEQVGDKVWKVRHREGLQTIRFDNANQLSVDFSRSKGVIGYTRHHESLYVYLDAVVEEAVIALQEAFGQGSRAGFSSSAPFLLDSQWEIWNLRREGHFFQFSAKGWGKCQMRWSVPSNGVYSLSVSAAEESTIKAQEGILSIDLDLPFNTATEFVIRQIVR